MENIILTNNKDLRLVSVKVGVLSTLRFELPLVSASATHVEVIVTSGNVPSAYTATFIDATKRWQCDIAASQFPTVGKQSYEVAYVLDGKQFWDGKGWIEIENATTSGIEPQPRPEPYRYAVVSVNGYGADAQGAVRIPKTFIATDSPTTTEGFMEGDIYFNRSTGATWTLCNVQGVGQWEPFAAPVTLDDTVTPTSGNGVKSSGIWSAIWGALSALPTGFTSLYDWCVAQLAGKANDNAVVKLTGDQTIWGVKSFYSGIALVDGADIDVYNGGRVIIRTTSGVVVTFNHNGIDYSTDDMFNYVHYDWPAASGTLALTAGTGLAGNLAALDTQGNPTDSTIPAANVALKGDLPYDLGTPTVIDTASSETVEGETVNYGAATLANRTANIVQVTAATALDELRITFPAATSGKVRDFGLRVEIGTGSAALTAPALVPIAPTGETIKLENADGAIPALADGTATAKGVTLLYFSETAPGVFVVKGEQVEEVA